jgi:hypothetical protein
MDRYWWWNGSDLLDLFGMVTKEGAQNLRLEFHPKDDGAELKLVDRETGEPCGTYNFGHTCPPNCP